MRHKTLRTEYPEIPEITHKQLVDRAFLYLKFALNCSIAFKERQGSTMENPDAIGFRSGFSYLIECKTSRADFLADKKKSFRKNTENGMGCERYVMAPVGLLEPSEMPDGWGLLEVGGKRSKGCARQVEEAKGSENFYNRNLQNEVSYLVSAIRRINISMCVFVETKNLE